MPVVTEVECCDVLFTRTVLNNDRIIGGQSFTRGRDLWISDTGISNFNTQGCDQLIGILMNDPETGRDRLRICNCTALCFVEGDLTTDPATGHNKFKGRVPVTCCTCQVTFATDPCCGPVLTVPADCFGVTSYDTCSAPSFGQDTLEGLCYRHDFAVDVTFPDTIVCDSVTYYFDRAEIRFCGVAEPTIVETANVVFTTPSEKACPGFACTVDVIAFYKLVCCDCEFSFKGVPCDDATKTISFTSDCEARQNMTMGATPSPPICYAHGSTVTVTFPGSINCGAGNLDFSFIKLTVCGVFIGNFINPALTIDVPSEEACPGECTVKIEAHYAEPIPDVRCGDFDRELNVKIIIGGKVELACGRCDREGLIQDCQTILCSFSDFFAGQVFNLPHSVTRAANSQKPVGCAGRSCVWNFQQNFRELEGCPVRAGEETCVRFVSGQTQLQFAMDFFWDSDTGEAWLTATLNVFFSLFMEEFGGCFPNSTICPSVNQGFNAFILPGPDCGVYELGIFGNADAAISAGLAIINGWDWDDGGLDAKVVVTR